MSALQPTLRGMFFEDYEVGRQVVSSGRTITEADIVGFAGLSGDFNQIHTDAEYSKNSAFGKRVAHGILGLSIASGLAVQTGMMEGAIMAFREINSWKFIKPVFIGDTIHVVLKVLETKAIPRVGGGSVVLELDVRNQEEVTVMKGNWTALIRSKGEA